MRQLGEGSAEYAILRTQDRVVSIMLEVVGCQLAVVSWDWRVFRFAIVW